MSELKAYTVEESKKKEIEDNERAKKLYGYLKDKDPKLANMIIKDVGLMPSDVIYEESKNNKDQTGGAKEYRQNTAHKELK